MDITGIFYFVSSTAKQSFVSLGLSLGFTVSLGLVKNTKVSLGYSKARVKPESVKVIYSDAVIKCGLPKLPML